MTEIDMSDVVGDLDFERSIVMSRPTTTDQTNGTVDIDYEDDVTIDAVVQPAKFDEIKLLPEAMRLDNIVAVWSLVELRASNGKDRDGDILTIDSRKFVVVKEMNRSANGFYKVLAQGYVT